MTRQDFIARTTAENAHIFAADQSFHKAAADMIWCRHNNDAKGNVTRICRECHLKIHTFEKGQNHK